MASRIPSPPSPPPPGIPPAPRLLDAFQAASPRALRLCLALFLFVWLAFLAIDWTARFALFHWHRTWLPAPPSAASANPSPPDYRAVILPSWRGGDLSRTLPLPILRDPYLDTHPEYSNITDPDGYPNAPLRPGETWQAVVVGDSFMLAGGPRPFTAELEDLAGIRVLNHAHAASGPIMQVRDYASSPPLDPEPGVVVWAITGRDIHANIFRRHAPASWFARSRQPTPAPDTSSAPSSFSPAIRWERLAPNALSSDLPNTSLSAYVARKGSDLFRFFCFRAWPHDVWGTDTAPFGPVLFYRENLRVLPSLTPDNAPPVANVIAQVSDGFRDRGVRLVVVLIPEKEQVLADCLPPDLQASVAPSVRLLGDLETELRSRSIPVVNLLPPFREETAASHLLYWRDDTHWNHDAIRLAASLVAPHLPSPSPATP